MGRTNRRRLEGGGGIISNAIAVVYSEIGDSQSAMTTFREVRVSFHSSVELILIKALMLKRLMIGRCRKVGGITNVTSLTSNTGEQWSP